MAENNKRIGMFTHDDDRRKNLPSAEQQPFVPDNVQQIRNVIFARNRDADPQLVWRGKDIESDGDLSVDAPPLYIQERIHPKALVDDLVKRTAAAKHESGETTADLFSDFDGLPNDVDKTEFYAHDRSWSNRMILGDSLQVMASLSEREGLRGKVQCIYLDPPYGIKFDSNFQWSTTSREVKDNKPEHITREPEMVKAFRDTWRDGIHSYLGYLRDRLIAARDLLCDSGSIFVQIGDDNVHRVRLLLDEIFGDDNCIHQITFRKSGALTSNYLNHSYDVILWYAKKLDDVKYRRLFLPKPPGGDGRYNCIDLFDGTRRRLTAVEKNDPSFMENSGRVFVYENLYASAYGKNQDFPIFLRGKEYSPSANRCWKTNKQGIDKLCKIGRVDVMGSATVPGYILFHSDYPVASLTDVWMDTQGATDLTYVVQTSTKVIERCILMATDPGDLVVDPTCGSGSTAYVAEQWGRRWITIDTSRVSLALARTRLMAAKYPYYLLADSLEGKIKEGEIQRRTPSTSSSFGNIRQGFVYNRVPHITLKSIANNSEIDIIWDKFESRLQQIRKSITANLPANWLPLYRSKQKYSASVPEDIQEWEIARDFPEGWSSQLRTLHTEFWSLRIQRQKEIDASIAAKADFEFLYDKPYEDKKRVRVSGPFTVESVSPHRVISDADTVSDDRVATALPKILRYSEGAQFTEMILNNLRKAGVQQSSKEDKLVFESLKNWPGNMICAAGVFAEGFSTKRAGIYVGPEFGTVSRPDLVAAAREAADSGFDVLIACAFNYDALSTELNNLGPVPILKARMNADLHMGEELANNGKGNLFVIFGEPDIELLTESDGQLKVKLNGVDVYRPQTGEVTSDGPDDVACWFIDTDYNEESFFVRHAYFPGTKDPYTSLKATLKAEIDMDAWSSLNKTVSRPFPKPKSGRVAVKAINSFGDEVMKVIRV
jgi:adenine-specific DNA-methyltransferase